MTYSPYYGASPEVVKVLEANQYLATLHHNLFQRLQALSFQKGHFVLASGKTSTYYLDCRKTSLDAEGSLWLGELLSACLLAQQAKPDAVAGMVLGAAPLVTAVTTASARQNQPLQGVLVRKEVKGHGGGRQIEGNLAPWMRTALLEDVVTTGGSTIKAAQALKAAYPTLPLSGVWSIVDRQGAEKTAFDSLGLPYHWLYSVEAFL